MDHLFEELIGKPQLNPAKLITIVAENFTLIDDQAKFLRATLAIPAVKQLPLEDLNKILIQLGPIHCEISDLLERDGKQWIVRKYEGDTVAKFCDQIETDSSVPLSQNRSIIFINDASKLLMATMDRKEIQIRFLRLIDSWKRVGNHFVVVLFQQSTPKPEVTFLRDLEYISDACVLCKSNKNCYFKSIWFQPSPTRKSLMPPRVETNYFTCKIGKSYWSADLLCFYDRKRVSPNYDLETCDALTHEELNESHQMDQPNEEDIITPDKALKRIVLDSDDEDGNGNTARTLPFIHAQNPENSKIFYYPDKDDDIDEDDPDNDLNF